MLTRILFAFLVTLFLVGGYGGRGSGEVTPVAAFAQGGTVQNGNLVFTHRRRRGWLRRGILRTPADTAPLHLNWWAA